MRKIADMVVVSHNTTRGNEWDFKRDCNELVMGGYVPYGKPYTNGNVLFREFVKYEYRDIDVDEELEDDPRGEDPWETHDFFHNIDDEFGG